MSEFWKMIQDQVEGKPNEIESLRYQLGIAEEALGLSHKAVSNYSERLLAAQARIAELEDQKKLASSEPIDIDSVCKHLTISDAELLSYGIEEELLLLANEDDYLAIAREVINLVRKKLKIYTTPQPAPDTTPPKLEETGRSLIVVQRVWAQVSADYDAAERTRTLSVTPDTTVGEVMRWAAAAHVLGRGDVILTEQD